MSDLRIGHGIDAHRYVPNRPLMLGCIEVPYGKGLLGHSDGDAVAHALSDALLGAAGLGDMGRHFPSSDPQWKGRAGAQFLNAVAQKISEAGFVIVSAQVVILAEEPRMSPHLAQMMSAICAALNVEAGTVTVSATTSDGMDAAGRNEGVFASAVALLEKSSNR